MAFLVTRGLGKGADAKFLSTAGLGKGQAPVDSLREVGGHVRFTDEQHLHAMREDEELIIIARAFVEIVSCHH